MNSRVLAKGFYVSLICVFMISCGDKQPDSDSDFSSSLKIESVSTTAFTSSLKGQFKGISKVDIALGKHGVLYCVKSDQAESIFKSWKDGNDNAECQMFINKYGMNDESFSGTIGNLYPDTEYSFCLFSQNSDNSVREISDIHTFKTLEFRPGIKNINLKDIHYIDANAEVEFGIDASDAEYCEYGVMLSESSNIDFNTASGVFKYTGYYESSITQSLTGLKPDKSYYCRPFVKYKTAGGNDEYMYGMESSFSTMTSDQMWVDLELPSGIRWANCDLGHYEFVYAWGATYYQWESTSPIDAANQILGGKWRMPTKADVDELIANCDLSKVEYVKHTNYYNGEAREVNAPVGFVIGANGKEILFNLNHSYWCGTPGGDDNPYSFNFNANVNASTGRYIPDTGRIEVQSDNKTGSNCIRPVWDPNIQD